MPRADTLERYENGAEHLMARAGTFGPLAFQRNMPTPRPCAGGDLLCTGSRAKRRVEGDEYHGTVPSAARLLRVEEVRSGWSTKSAMDPPPSEWGGEHSMGTSIMAVAFDGGVVMGADSRTSTGSYVAFVTLARRPTPGPRPSCLRPSAVLDPTL
jgi:hypothetical protein